MKTVLVHQFKLGDVEDVEIYAAQSLYDFEQSDKGQWVMKNAVETPMWSQRLSADVYGYQISVTATFTDDIATFFLLKWGEKS